MFYIRWFGVWVSVHGGLLFQKSYSRAWDKTLENLIDTKTPVKFNPHTVEIGDYEVWISNRWYSYATPYCGAFSVSKRVPECRPSIKVMIKFSDYIESQAFK